MKSRTKFQFGTTIVDTAEAHVAELTQNSGTRNSEIPEALKRFYFISTICDPRQKESYQYCISSSIVLPNMGLGCINSIPYVKAPAV
jgi:hypothetical protein